MMEEWSFSYTLDGELIGYIDKEGIVVMSDGHAADELAAMWLTGGTWGSSPDHGRTLSTGMLRSALGVTWNDRTTRAFWDAVRERLLAPPVPTAE